MKLTTWVIKEKEIEKFLEDWKQGILKNVKDRDLIITNDIHGSFNSPSKKYKGFRTAGFLVSRNALKDESISPFMCAIAFAFYFLPKGKIDFEKVEKEHPESLD